MNGAQIARTSAVAREGEGHHRGLGDDGEPGCGGGGQAIGKLAGRGELDRPGLGRIEETLKVVLFQARELQRVAEPDVEREIALGPPVVLNVAGGRAPSVVIGDGGIGQDDGLRNAQQEAGDGVASDGGLGSGGSGLIGLQVAELIVAARDAVQRLGV